MLLISRLAFISTTIMSSSSCLQFFCPPQNDRNAKQQHLLPPLVAEYHEPPPSYMNESSAISSDDYYSNNPSVFGKILRGEIPSRTYVESTELLAFRDISSKAPLHALIIPKRYVKSVYSLRASDSEEDENNDSGIELIQSMRQMGLDLIEQQLPEAFAKNDYKLCFHIPPFNSVDHLHLHVLAPASEMSWLYRDVKYNCGAIWCTSDLEVIERLQSGLPAVRNPRPFFY